MKKPCGNNGFRIQLEHLIKKDAGAAVDVVAAGEVAADEDALMSPRLVSLCCDG